MTDALDVLLAQEPDDPEAISTRASADLLWRAGMKPAGTEPELEYRRLDAGMTKAEAGNYANWCRVLGVKP